MMYNTLGRWMEFCDVLGKGTWAKTPWQRVAFLVTIIPVYLLIMLPTCLVALVLIVVGGPLCALINFIRTGDWETKRRP